MILMCDEMIVVTLKGRDAQLWRDIMGSLELEEQKGDYERFVNEVFVAGLMEFHKFISQNLGGNEFKDAVRMIEDLSHALVLYDQKLDNIIEASSFVTLLDGKVLIGYENKQEVKGGVIFFTPDHVGVMIPTGTILDADVQIELEFEGR